MDWPTAAVAIVAAGASSGVAVVTMIKQTNKAIDDRKHDRDIRRAEARRAAYVELMTLMHRLMMGVDRTAPIFVQGEPPEPPPPLAIEDAWHVNALADVIASEEIRNAMEEWSHKQNEFYVAVWYLRTVQQDEQRPSSAWLKPSEVRERYGVTSMEQWQKVDGIRKDLQNDLRAIGSKVRAEL